MVNLVRRNPLPKAVAGGFITLLWALVALLEIWQSLLAHSKSNQHYSPSFGPPAPLWWGQVNPHSRSQPSP